MLRLSCRGQTQLSHSAAESTTDINAEAKLNSDILLLKGKQNTSDKMPQQGAVLFSRESVVSDFSRHGGHLRQRCDTPYTPGTSEAQKRKAPPWDAIYLTT